MVRRHPAAMETPILRDRRDLAEVVHVLVLVQAGVLVALAIEATLFLSFTGPAAVAGVVFGGVAAVLALAVAAGLGARRGWARRVTLVAEAVILLVGLLDLALLGLTGSTPVALVVLSRIVLPLTLIVVLRSASVRSAFGLA